MKITITWPIGFPWVDWWPGSISDLGLKWPPVFEQLLPRSPCQAYKHFTGAGYDQCISPLWVFIKWGCFIPLFSQDLWSHDWIFVSPSFLRWIYSFLWLKPFRGCGTRARNWKLPLSSLSTLKPGPRSWNTDWRRLETKQPFQNFWLLKFCRPNAITSFCSHRYRHCCETDLTEEGYTQEAIWEE